MLTSSSVHYEGSALAVYFGDVTIAHTRNTAGLVVTQTNDYYPFGLPITPLGYQNQSSNINDYKYNGKELQTEFGLGWMDYGWRVYDPATSRWSSVDPLADKYFNISPYAYVADNPVIFLDPDGRVIEGDVNRVNNLKERGNSIKEAEGRRQGRLETKISERGAAGKNTTRLERRVSNSRERVEQVNEALTEIKSLEESETVYHVNSDYTAQSGGPDGETTYEGGKVMVNVARSYGLHGLAHELKHAYQFETGQLDFHNKTGGPGLLYDINDEVAAFQRQFAFKPSSLGSISSASEINARFVQQLDALYMSLPRANLNVNTGLGDIEWAYKHLGRTINLINLNPVTYNQTYKDANYSNFTSKP